MQVVCSSLNYLITVHAILEANQYGGNLSARLPDLYTFSSRRTKICETKSGRQYVNVYFDINQSFTPGKFFRKNSM